MTAALPTASGDAATPRLVHCRLVHERAVAGELPVEEALERLARHAEQAVDDQRRAGSFYTAGDVTRYIVSRTLGAAVLELLARAGLTHADADAVVTANEQDPTDAAAAAIASLDDEARDHAWRLLAGLRVLDPTCGSGAFLLEAGRQLARLGELVEAPPGWWLRCLHGVDLSPVAVDACRRSLDLLARQLGGAAAVADVERRVRCADALAAETWEGQPPFDVVVGNPPYVRAPACGAGDLRTAACGNLYAWVAERALQQLRPGGRCGLVLPVSVLCADRFEQCRRLWRDACDTVWASSYDTIPSTLFPGIVQRLAIMLGRTRVGPPGSSRWYVTRYHKWRAAERDQLFTRMRYVDMPPQTVNGSVAKVGTAAEHRLLERLFAHPPAARLLLRTPANDAPNTFWYKRRWSYYLLFLDFVPPLYDAAGALRDPTEFKPVHVVPGVDARVLLATYNSTLFYWFFTVFSDNRNVNLRDLGAFPFATPHDDVARELCSLADELMLELRASAELRECSYRSIGTIRNTYFRQAATRPVIDRIDAVLARHYGFDDELLSFVLDFEADYRTRPVTAGR